MGGAIVRGICRSGMDTGIRVANPSASKLESLRADCPGIVTTHSNTEAAGGADAVILAVKPWILPGVVEELKPLLVSKKPIVISIAGGVDLPRLEEMLGDGLPLFHVIPDTAISVGHGMTFIASRHADEAARQAVRDIFATMGRAALVEDRLMGAATALSSCGIAYVFKYIQACVQAGVQLGFRPDDALNYVTATVDGAVALLQADGVSPQEEIDRVTTPGGMTIRGINALEHSGFTSAVINGIIEPLKK